MGRVEVEMNVVVLCGRLSSAPVIRELESGSVLMNCELTTRVDDVANSVPLVWFDPPAAAVFEAGDEVAVVGTVRRRFYRAGASTQSRTEVVVELLGKVGDKRAATARRKWINAAMGADLLNGLRSF
jgi:single-strand DNA-binding protein